MLKTYLPDEITLPNGKRLLPVIGGHIGQKPFLTKERSGVDVTKNGWRDQIEYPNSEHGERKLIVAEAKARKLAFRTVKVLSRNLRAKNDLYGRSYTPTVWIFVESPTP